MNGGDDGDDEVGNTIDAPTNPRSVDVETEGVAKFDLTLALVLLVDAAGTIVSVGGELNYNTDLFNTATAQRMAQHYLQLLRSIADRPNQPTRRGTGVD